MEIAGDVADRLSGNLRACRVRRDDAKYNGCCRTLRLRGLLNLLRKPGEKMGLQKPDLVFWQWENLVGRSDSSDIDVLFLWRRGYLNSRFSYREFYAHGGADHSDLLSDSGTTFPN